MVLEVHFFFFLVCSNVLLFVAMLVQGDDDDVLTSPTAFPLVDSKHTHARTRTHSD